MIVYIVQDSRVGNQRGQKIGLLTSASLDGPWAAVGPGGVVVQPSTDPANYTVSTASQTDNIGVDGGHHAEHARADARREAVLARAGYRVLRLDAALVIRDTDAAVSGVPAALER